MVVRDLVFLLVPALRLSDKFSRRIVVKTSADSMFSSQEISLLLELVGLVEVLVAAVA